ncbi:MAG: NUDIX hydrolase [Selenomonadaceae bacterium]|uniref:NUDIX hydrolase n=1 Tax=Anaerovibrio slackiae TaxID=2652309 RepID=A0A6I2UJC9_9FIRM|nr:NUDIX hydrolase [Anaerovibrio slackiae]MBQ2010375.1 NUDIX hydrolase [Selenomonadaceae bacterium]MBQ5586384.1 NUDIX hydrolase [Selenomonadaceae bacterium]MBQ5845408.1 NUDIX hydrolase [Selenomonadaceae bacterium]MBR0328309.1 NUDIX hydrolase [Selenomonadaceae bacterium]MDD6164509.1 NUDIX hydrolase [Anaerovibrio slackiae]
MAKDWELDKNMGKDADLIEEKVSSEDVFDGNLLHVKKDTVRLPNGNIAYREWIKHPGASAVVPVTPEGRLIFVRQYRYPIQQVTLEIPAGKLDAEGEDPLDCARRELSEETGYQAEKYTFLTKLATTVGFSNEFIYIYAAEGLTAGRQHPDEDEFINVCTLTMDEAMAKIRSGEICDAKSVTAVLLLRDLQDSQGR